MLVNSGAEAVGNTILCNFLIIAGEFNIKQKLECTKYFVDFQ